jgi:hypothetical protein
MANDTNHAVVRVWGTDRRTSSTHVPEKASRESQLIGAESCRDAFFEHCPGNARVLPPRPLKCTPRRLSRPSGDQLCRLHAAAPEGNTAKPAAVFVARRVAGTGRVYLLKAMAYAKQTRERPTRDVEQGRLNAARPSSEYF